MAVAKLKDWDEGKIEVDLCAIGNKGLGFMQRLAATSHPRWPAWATRPTWSA
jgi:hypothetical protein